MERQMPDLSLEELIRKHIAESGVTRCPTAYSRGVSSWQGSPVSESDREALDKYFVDNKSARAMNPDRVAASDELERKVFAVVCPLIQAGITKRRLLAEACNAAGLLSLDGSTWTEKRMANYLRDHPPPQQ
jgi:hypothetical protein